MDYYKLLENKKQEMMLASTTFSGLKNELENAISQKLLEDFRFSLLYNKKNDIYFEFHKIQAFLFLNSYIDSETLDREEVVCTRFHVRPLINENHKHFEVIKSGEGLAVSERSEECFKINPLPYYFEINFDYKEGFMDEIFDHKFAFQVEGYPLAMKKLDLEKTKELGLKT